MGLPVLILGESGTGKSTSMRNFNPEDVAIVNVAGKPLPFRGRGFEMLSGTTDFREIYLFMKKTQKKVIVIDDAQYIMSFQYMRRIKENGWDKFNELQSDFFNLIDIVKTLPADTVVYFLSHLETKEDGRQKIKTIGKMLDEKITIEGMFSIVLKTYTADGKYYFLTQNSGNDTVKSPMEMFPSYAIDNDLKYVDDKIRNYYQMGLFLSDEEMKALDDISAKTEVNKDEVEGKKRRGVRGGKKDDGNTESDGNTGKRRKVSEAGDSSAAEQRDEADGNSENNTGQDDAAAGQQRESHATESTSGTGRRRRKVSDELGADREKVEKENAETIANAGLDQAEGDEGVSFDEVENPEVKEPPRRKARGAMNKPEPAEEPTTDEQPAEETTRRRRRR